MANEPKKRHSKPNRPAVTIDLDPSDVQKVRDEAAATAPDEDVTETAPQDADREPQDITSTVAEETPPEADAAATEHVDDGAAPEAHDASPEVADEAPGEGAGPKEAIQPKVAEERRRAPVLTMLGGGIVGGVVALAAGAALQWNGILPAPQGDLSALKQEVADMKANPPQAEGIDQDTRAAIVSAQEAANSALSHADAANAAAEQIKDDLASLQNTVKGLQSAPASATGADLKALNDRIATVERTLSNLSQTPQAGTDLKTSVDQMSTRLDTLGGRLDAMATKEDETAAIASSNAQAVAGLKSDVAGLQKQIAENAGQPKIARAIAVSALKSAIDRGGPFVPELDTYASVAPQSPQVEALRPFAAKGVPTISELQTEFPAVADRIVAATRPTQPNEGFLGHLIDSAKSLVKMRPVGMVEGTTPEAIVARMEAALASGDPDRALTEWMSLPDAAKNVSTAFADSLRARRDADKFVAAALAEAINPGAAGTSN